MRGVMINGVQSLESILVAARSKAAQLEVLFDVPVLLLVSEDSDLEPVTSVASPRAASSPDFAGDRQTTLVVPIQSRLPVTTGKVQLSFGRSEVCDVIIPIASVSKHHGYFELMGQVWLVSDVGSTNGTAADGRTVTRNGIALTDRCSLRLGRVLTQFLSAKSFCALLRQRLPTE